MAARDSKSPDASFRQQVAVLYSEATRQGYIQEALASGEVYAFTSAWGEQRHWLKGSAAYLAPNAATTLLLRYNIKHDLIGDEEVTPETLAAYRLLLVPNAAYLPDAAIAAIAAWLRADSETGRRLIVTGRTNLPPELLGLSTYEPLPVSGFTGWRFIGDHPFADTTRWEDYYLTSYRGFATARVLAGTQGRALADLWEFDGDITSAATATRRRLGHAIVATDRTLFIANQVLEYLGGAIQAQFDVDALRGWYHPAHYLDTMGYLLRELCRELGPADLFTTQLRAFGTYSGALILRHDADTAPDTSPDFAMLEWEAANQVPATYVVLDPAVSPEHTSPSASSAWVAAAQQTNLHEVGLHNDGYSGSPPTYVAGTTMYEHFRDGDRALGIVSNTAGRHFGFHRHPETLDAMDYLYAHAPDLLGLCTFSVLQVIAYGVAHPDRTWLGRPITYSTRFQAGAWTSGAVPGWWFPYHAVIATVEERRTLRGWDSTKESDCDFDRADVLLAGVNSRDVRFPSRLDNAVLTVQYHPQQAHDPTLNDGHGSLPWVRYLCASAERRGYWLANKRTVYARLNDYQAVRFRAEPDGTILVGNPTQRHITGLMVELPGSIGAVRVGEVAYLHIVNDNTFTLPPLAPGAALRLVPQRAADGLPIIRQPNSKALEILNAQQTRGQNTIEVLAHAVARSTLTIERLVPLRWYDITIGGPDEAKRQLAASAQGRLSLPITVQGPTTITISIGESA